MSSSSRDDVWYALVADDDDDCRQLLVSALRRCGFEVCEAPDGEELVKRYEALSKLACRHIVVVSDIAMPGRDGVSATAWLRNASTEVPIILVTGESSPQILRAAQAAGASAILPKPLNGAHLRQVLSSLCR